MKWILLSVGLLFACAVSSQVPSVPIMDVNALEARLQKGADTTFVVNFWATWCGPCVKELPYFEALRNENSANPLKVLLITLDFVENVESKVIPFIENKGIKSEVLLLDEGNPNQWIPRISNEWSGAIPATLFVNAQQEIRHFHEGSFKEGELETKLRELGL